MRKFSLLAIAILTCALGFAQPIKLKNFDELMNALNSGENVRVIVHYGKCTLISDNEIETKVPDAIGGLTIDTYEYFAKKAVRNNEKAFVVFSENKFILYPKGDGFVYNYAKFKVEDDGKVKITVMYIDPLTHKELMNENFFTTISEDASSGISFYLQR